MSSTKLLYFSCDEWGNLGRRKIRLAYEFAQRNDVASALYVNPPVQTSLLDLARGRFLPSHLGDERGAHLAAVRGNARRETEKLWVYTGSTKTLPLTRIERLRRFTPLLRLNAWVYVSLLRRQVRRLPGEELVVWFNHPLQSDLLSAFPKRRLACYDWTDDWSQFSILPVEDAAQLERSTQAILGGVDVVFAVSEHLRERAAAANPATVLAPNATDYAILSQAADTALPPADELVDIPAPRLGYIGQIGDNFDYDLVQRLAEAHAEWSFVFVGPVWSSRKARVARLSALSNVHFLGPQPHGRLPAFLRGFDVCLMPHQVDALTASMDPTKLYDYLASGKPIVSTRVAGTGRFADVVYLGDGPKDFERGVEAALGENGARRDRRLRYARDNSWPERAAEVWRAFVERV